MIVDENISRVEVEANSIATIQKFGNNLVHYISSVHEHEKKLTKCEKK